MQGRESNDTKTRLMGRLKKAIKSSCDITTYANEYGPSPHSKLHMKHSTAFWPRIRGETRPSRGLSPLLRLPERLTFRYTLITPQLPS